METQLFLDLETTGFSRQWDFIIEVAGILCDNQGNVLDTFHEYIKPGKSIPAKITELTGISNYQVQNCRSEREVLMDFNEWVAIAAPSKIIGHNCKAFDLDFIQKKNDFYHYSNRWIESGEIIDTLNLARTLNKQGKIHTDNCKQPTLAQYFDINYEAHSAIEDTKALIQVYNAMMKINTPPSRAQLGF